MTPPRRPVPVERPSHGSGAQGGGRAVPLACRAASRSLQRALAQRLPLLPAPPRALATPTLQSLHPLLINCGYSSISLVAYASVTLPNV